MNKETGGPAFPCYEFKESYGQMMAVGGMTLRDYFAVHAPITYQDAIEWLDCYGGEIVGPWSSTEITATLVDLRNNYADKMIEARK
jgi:hypothetical protein